MRAQRKYKRKERQVSLNAENDVIVVGGGPAGCAAATAVWGGPDVAWANNLTHTTGVTYMGAWYIEVADVFQCPSASPHPDMGGAVRIHYRLGVRGHRVQPTSVIPTITRRCHCCGDGDRSMAQITAHLPSDACRTTPITRSAETPYGLPSFGSYAWRHQLHDVTESSERLKYEG